MLTAIFWVLFVGSQGLQGFPTLADCAAAKHAVLARYPAPLELIVCVPQERPR